MPLLNSATQIAMVSTFSARPRISRPFTVSLRETRSIARPRCSCVANAAANIAIANAPPRTIVCHQRPRWSVVSVSWIAASDATITTSASRPNTRPCSPRPTMWSIRRTVADSWLSFGNFAGSGSIVRWLARTGGSPSPMTIAFGIDSAGSAEPSPSGSSLTRPFVTLLLVLRAVLVAVLDDHVQLVLRIDLAGHVRPRVVGLLGELVDHRDRRLDHRDALAGHRRLRILVRLADHLAQLLRLGLRDLFDRLLVLGADLLQRVERDDRRAAREAHRHRGHVLDLRVPLQRDRGDRRAVACLDLARRQRGIDLGDAARHAVQRELLEHGADELVVAPHPQLLALQVLQRLDLRLRHEIDPADLAAVLELEALLRELLLEVGPHLVGDVVDLLGRVEHHRQLEHADRLGDHREPDRGHRGAVELAEHDLAGEVHLVALLPAFEVLQRDPSSGLLLDLGVRLVEHLHPRAAGGRQRGHAELDVFGMGGTRRGQSGQRGDGEQRQTVHGRSLLSVLSSLVFVVFCFCFCFFSWVWLWWA